MRGELQRDELRALLARVDELRAELARLIGDDAGENQDDDFEEVDRRAAEDAQRILRRARGRRP